MSSNQEDEGIPPEVKELLKNYRNAKRASYEPCNNDNIAKCMAGLQEELNLLNIRYVFNPFTELSHGTLSRDALVTLINAIYTLLHEHKRLKEFADAQTESRHVTEKNNEALNKKLEQLTARLARSERDARAGVCEGLRAAEAAATAREELRRATARAHALQSRLSATEHALRVTSERAVKDCESLSDKFREKCGTFMSTSDSDAELKSIVQSNASHKQTIRKLTEYNRELTNEVLALKKEILGQKTGREKIAKENQERDQ